MRDEMEHTTFSSHFYIFYLSPCLFLHIINRRSLLERKHGKVGLLVIKAATPKRHSRRRRTGAMFVDPNNNPMETPRATPPLSPLPTPMPTPGTAPVIVLPDEDEMDPSNYTSYVKKTARSMNDITNCIPSIPLTPSTLILPLPSPLSPLPLPPSLSPSLPLSLFDSLSLGV